MASAAGSWVQWSFGATGGNRWPHLTHALKSRYKEDNTTAGLLADDPYYRVPLSSYVVNLANAKLVEEAFNSMKSSKGDPEIEQVYRRMLDGLAPGRDRGCCHDLCHIFRTDLDSLGWIAITGVDGYGSGTIGQYITYTWSMEEENRGKVSEEATELSHLLDSRYHLIFRIRCQLLGNLTLYEDCEDQTALGYLCELAYLSVKSVSHLSALSREDIRASIIESPSSVLLVLDGFDNVRLLYGVDAKVTAIIDKAMSFPSGIITCKKHSLPHSWESSHRIRNAFELVGMSTRDSTRYIRNHFKKSVTPAVADMILKEIKMSEAMSTMIVAPINCVALCVTWDAIATGEMGCETNGMAGSTVVYHRIVMWLVLRYSMMFKISASERRVKETRLLTMAVARELYGRCVDELYALSSVAFHAFKLDEDLSQAPITDELLSRYFPDVAMLRRLVATLGLLRVGPLNYTSADMDSLPVAEDSHPVTYSTTIRFIHIRYYEYFTALYIVENLCRSSQITSDELDTIKEMDEIRSIIRARNVRYRNVLCFVAGLLALPDYKIAADAFWGILLNNSTEMPTMSHVATIGIHHSFLKIKEHKDIILESRRTIAWLQSLHPSIVTNPEVGTVPNAAQPLSAAANVDCFLLWDHLAEATVLQPLWDYEHPNRNTKWKQESFERADKSFCRIRKSLSFSSRAPVLDLSRWLMLFPPYKQIATACAEKVTAAVSSAVKCAAIGALMHAAMNDNNTISVLRGALDDTDDAVRLVAAEALSRLHRRDERSLTTLTDILDSKDDRLRMRAAFVLGSLGSSERSASALRALRAALNNTSLEVCCAAAEALGDTNSLDASVISILTSALQDPDARTRQKAVEAMGHIAVHDNFSMSLLRESLSDSDWGVAAAAAVVLEIVGQGSEYSRSRIHNLMREKDTYMRTVSCELLGQMRASDKPSLALLRAALSDDEWAVRYAAAESLNIIRADCSNIMEDEAVNAVFQTAIMNSEWAIRYAAAEALGRSGANNHVSVSLLQKAMKDTTKYVRLAAADAFGRIGYRDGTTSSLLRDMARTDTYWNARRAAVEAIGRGSAGDVGADTLAVLRAALRDDDCHVCRAAALAIKHIVSRDFIDDSTIIALLDCITVESIADFSSETAIDLDIIHEIHIALLRISPQRYVLFFNSNPANMANKTALQCFLFSSWLHSSCVRLVELPESGPCVLVDGKCVKVNCPIGEFEKLFVHVSNLEVEFMNVLIRDQEHSTFAAKKVENATGNDDATHENNVKLEEAEQQLNFDTAVGMDISTLLEVLRNLMI